MVVTFDEADFIASWDAGQPSTYDGPNQVYTVLLGDQIEPGVEADEGYNHYSLIRTIEENFGLGSLHKNDAEANWHQFLWGRRFAWRPPEATPVRASLGLAAAALGGALYVVSAGEHGALSFRTFDGAAWSEERHVGHRTTGPFALARCREALHLVYTDEAGGLVELTYQLGAGWSASPRQLAKGPVSHPVMTSCADDRRLMLVYSDESHDLQSLSFREDGWAPAPVPVGHRGGGPMALSALGATLLLVTKSEATGTLLGISYNLAPFNVVTIAPGDDGPCDDTTMDAWSPSAFPVADFSTAPTPVTPGEREPTDHVYTSSGPLCAAQLDGVVHLGHPGLENPLLLDTTFSTSGILTSRNAVVRRRSADRKTSNGFGTLAEAGWSRAVPSMEPTSTRAASRRWRASESGSTSSSRPTVPARSTSRRAPMPPPSARASGDSLSGCPVEQQTD